jgi:hypothetical protein
MKRAVSGSVCQSSRSEDTDPHPDPYQNVTDPEARASVLYCPFGYRYLADGTSHAIVSLKKY